MAVIPETENMSRERQARLGPIEAARQAGAIRVRQQQTGNATTDQSGYFDDEAGQFVSFFTLDESALDGPDVLK